MSIDNIESQIHRLLKQNYDPWSDSDHNEVVHAINEPIIYEIANWIFSVLRLTVEQAQEIIIGYAAKD